jgi:hypothetical protein
LGLGLSLGLGLGGVGGAIAVVGGRGREVCLGGVVEDGADASGAQAVDHGKELGLGLAGAEVGEEGAAEDPCHGPRAYDGLGQGKQLAGAAHDGCPGAHVEHGPGTHQLGRRALLECRLSIFEIKPFQG